MGILKGILGDRAGKKNYSKDIGVPIAGDMVEFCLVASEGVNCAILIGLADFPNTWKKVYSYFDSKIGYDDDVMASASSPRAICANCMKEYTGMSIISLTGAGEALGEEAIENCPGCHCEDVYYIFQAGNRVKIPDD
jgi:hypothetical protein